MSPINAIGFIYNAFAHVTDGEQLAEELVVVAESLQLFEVDNEQFLEIYDWYTDVHSKGEEEMQNTLHECISVVEQFFKQNDSDKVIRMIFIEQLVNIAKADGVIKDSETTWLKNFCKVMEVDEPASMHESIPVDTSPTIVDPTDKIMNIICDQSSTLDQIKEVVEADPNAVHAQQDNGGDEGYSALHYAAWDSKADIVKYLIDNGADVNLKGKDGCSPIVLCGVAPSQTDCVKLLVESGAVLENRNMEPNMYHIKGATVLRLAVINCCYDTADFLIEKGASVDVLFEPCDEPKAGTSDFFEACTLVSEHFPGIYDLERLNKIIEQVSNNESADNKNDLPTEEDKDEDSSTKGPMALTHKTKSDEEDQFLRDFIVKWMAETEDFAYAMSRIQFPSFLKEIDDACPIFTNEELTFINSQIYYEKCIPSLPYVHEPTFYHHTKQVWWIAPCVYWGEKLVSWVIVDKNGFYAPHPENWDDQDDVSAIFSWEMVEDISFDIEEFEDHAIATLNIESTAGGELTFYEFLSLNREDHILRGSYLSVFKSIFDVNYENIIQSRGAHSWNHGVGMEGFQSFKDPSELLNESIWQEARADRMNFKTNSLFDYNPDGEKDSSTDDKIEDKLDEKVSSSEEKTASSADEYYFEDYFREYKLKNNIEESYYMWIHELVDFLDDRLEGTDGLLQLCTQTGGYSLYADNKLRNGKFAQCRFGKSVRKEGKPVRYFVELYLLKSKMNYKIDSLPNQSLQSPHAHEFYVIRFYTSDDFFDNQVILEQRLKESLKARQKNKLITKRKNLSRKQLKEEYLRDLGI